MESDSGTNQKLTFRCWEVTRRNLEKKKVEKEYTKGLTWTYKDKSTRVKVVGWENQVYTSILDG